nr:MAG TPA: hypothetical protein [Caudoviricetes sp.]
MYKKRQSFIDCLSYVPHALYFFVIITISYFNSELQ